MNIVKYTKYEALKQLTLPWYHDEELNQKIYSSLILSKTKIKKVLDLCSGTSPILSYLSKSIEYIGIDSSQEMIKVAKNKYRALGYKKAQFVCLDINKFLAINKTLFKHILLKNALQFFNLRDILPKILNNLESDGIFLIVQTIKTNNQKDFIKLVNSPKLNQRKITRYTENDIVNVVESMGDIFNKKIYKQKIDIVEWLDYHEIEKNTIIKLIDSISKMTKDEKNSYNISKIGNKFYVDRIQIILSIKKKF